MADNKYTAKITSEHNQKPNFMGVVFNNTKPFASVQEFLGTYMQSFDLDTAIGAQLDVIGEWVGRTRYVGIPLSGVYFSWDDLPSIGWIPEFGKGSLIQIAVSSRCLMILIESF